MIFRFFLLLPALSAVAAETLFVFQKPAMGTLAEARCYAPDEETAGKAADSAFARLAEIEAFASDYRSDSELSRLNHNAGGDWTEVSPDLFHLLSAATHLSERSSGAFDITARPLIQLWKRAARRGEYPDATKLQSARALVDWRCLELRENPLRARLKKTGMSVDLGGITKGWAAAEMVKALRSSGVSQCLAAVAGDIATGDPPPGAKGWRVKILPRGSSRLDITETVTLACSAVSTSGDAHQFFLLNGQRYSHIVNPASGLPLTSGRAVTVLAPQGLDADSLATTLCVAGPDAAAELLPPGARAIFYEQANRMEKTAQESNPTSPRRLNSRAP